MPHSIVLQGGINSTVQRRCSGFLCLKSFQRPKTLNLGHEVRKLGKALLGLYLRLLLRLSQV